MTQAQFSATPRHDSYDVVIIGGAMMGTATAWYLSRDVGFRGRVLVVERDPTYAACSTAHTNSCLRQQFSTALNVRISQYAAEVVNGFRELMGGDPDVPHLSVRNFGYLYLADTSTGAKVLRENQAVQDAEGAGTRLLSVAEIGAEYPFYALDDIVLGSLNLVNEGYWDGATVFDWWRRDARRRGVEYVADEVVAITLAPNGTRIASVTLASGQPVSCGVVVNAAGPRASGVAAMAGVAIPVEPRKRYSWIFRAARPLDRALPLTIDPSGVHVRDNGGGTYLAGGAETSDPAVDPDDFSMDHALWETHAWPAIARRIPQFDAVKLEASWVGHYAMNTFDQNAIVGPHPEISNFLFQNGFSGHGLQQAPAMGRGLAEWIATGGYRTLDLSPFHFERIAKGRRIVEKAVI